MALLTQDRKVTGTLGAAQDTVKVYSAGLATVTFQIPTGLTGTVTFEATNDDAASPTLVAVPATNVATGTRATTAANPAGIYRVDASGLRMVQARVSAYTSGTTGTNGVIANGSHAPFSDPSGVAGGGGGGGGAATIADGADVAQGTTTDAGVVTDTTGTVIGFLRGLVKLLIGNIKVVGPTAGGAAETGNSVSIGFVGTGGTHRNATAAPSVNNTTGTDVIGVGPLLKGTTNFFNQQGDDSGNTKMVGTIAHDGVDSGAPVKTGAKAIAHGANPTAVSAADRTDLYANVAGIPFFIGGHPNIITRRDNYTAAQTDTALVTVGAGTIIVVTSQTFTCDKANTVNVTATSGFGTANTPTGAGVVTTHPGIDPGGGIREGNGAGIVGIGADNEDLRFTCTVPTGGSISVTTKYFTIPV